MGGRGKEGEQQVIGKADAKTKRKDTRDDTITKSDISTGIKTTSSERKQGSRTMAHTHTHTHRGRDKLKASGEKRRENHRGRGHTRVLRPSGRQRNALQG